MFNAMRLRGSQTKNYRARQILVIHMVSAILFTACSKKQPAVTDGLRVPEGYTIEKVAGSSLCRTPCLPVMTMREGCLFLNQAERQPLQRMCWRIQLLSSAYWKMKMVMVYLTRAKYLPIRSPILWAVLFTRAVCVQLHRPICCGSQIQTMMG